MKTTIILISGILMLVPLAQGRAADPSATSNNIRSQGYSEVASVLDSMTPKQRAAIMKQAEAYAKELEKMTPEERAAVMREASDVHKTLRSDGVDPKKLRAPQNRTLAQTRQDMAVYNRKYEAGKIAGPGIKPRSAY